MTDDLCLLKRRLDISCAITGGVVCGLMAWALLTEPHAGFAEVVIGVCGYIGMWMFSSEDIVMAKTDAAPKPQEAWRGRTPDHYVIKDAWVYRTPLGWCAQSGRRARGPISNMDTAMDAALELRTKEARA